MADYTFPQTGTQIQAILEGTNTDKFGKLFDSLTEAAVYIASNIADFPDETNIATASYYSKSECDALGVAYPDGGHANYSIVAGGTGTADSGSFIDVASKQLKLYSAPSLANFGIVDDGSLHDTRFSALLAYAGTVAPFDIDLKGVSVTLQNQPSLPSKVGLKNGTLDMSQVTGGGVGLLYITGTPSSKILLPVNASIGDTTITVPDASIFSVGQVVIIGSQEEHNAGEAIETLGELNTIEAVDTGLNTLSMATTMEYTYKTTESAFIRNVAWSESNELNKVKVIGPTSVEKRGIYATYCKNLTVKNCEIIDSDGRGMLLGNTYAPIIKNNKITIKAGTPAVNELRYGIGVADNCRFGIFEENEFIGGRHSISFTPSSGDGGTSIDCIVKDNFASGSHGASFATHQNSKRVMFRDNSVIDSRGGFDIRAKFITVRDNYVRSNSKYTPSFGVVIRKDLRLSTIENNRFEAVRDGIYTTETHANATFEFNRILRNQFVNVSQAGMDLTLNSNDLPIVGFECSGNTFKGVTGDAIIADGNFIDAEYENNKVAYASASTNHLLVQNGGTGTKILRNEAINSQVVKFDVSGNPSPVTPSNCSVFSNNYDYVSGYLSIIAGSNIVRVGNKRLNTSITATVAASAITAPIGIPLLALATTAATDLNTIGGGEVGDILVLSLASATYTITVKDSVDNIELASDFAMSSINDSLTLIRTGFSWIELARSSNA